MTQRTLLMMGAIVLALAASGPIAGQTGDKLYQKMSPTEQATFVEQHAREIARELSDSEYQFTPGFEMEIQRHIDSYVKRINNSASERLGKGDARLIFERGRIVAPTVIAAFKARKVSPLIGLYLPLVESEYVNVPNANAAGAVGMFQFLPGTGKRYGLSTDDLMNVEKSADAAARYIADNLERFAYDPMKEALAVLAYNRGGKNTESDLALVLDYQNKQCSICALSAARAKLDQTFQEEGVHYVPRFLAGAIIGENPQAFGLPGQPLSSYERK